MRSTKRTSKTSCLVGSLLATLFFMAECRSPVTDQGFVELPQQPSVPSRDGRTLSSSQRARWAAAAVAQVLAFNVSNFVAVLFIKALLVALGFATGFSGLGLYAGRRTDTQEFTYEFPVPPTTQQEENGPLRWLTTYLATLNSGDHMCLKRLACEQPERARFYAGAKEMLVSALRMAPPWLYSHNPAHDRIMASVRLAAQIGTKFHQLCRRKFPCRNFRSDR